MRWRVYSLHDVRHLRDLPVPASAMPRPPPRSSSTRRHTHAPSTTASSSAATALGPHHPPPHQSSSSHHQASSSHHHHQTYLQQRFHQMLLASPLEEPEHDDHDNPPHPPPHHHHRTDRRAGAYPNMAGGALLHVMVQLHQRTRVLVLSDHEVCDHQHFPLPCPIHLNLCFASLLTVPCCATRDHGSSISPPRSQSPPP